MPTIVRYLRRRWCGHSCEFSYEMVRGALLMLVSITDFNIIVSVLSMFILLVKAVLFIMHYWIPMVSLFVNIVILALWCVSVYGQAGPDYMDPEHPSSVAWYITKSCSLAEKYNQKHNCTMAKSCFAVSVLMVAIFFFNICLSIWSMFPTQEQKEKRAAKLARKAEEEEYEKELEKEWELRSMSQIKTPTFAPYTPRTMAFKSLDRQLPLRTDRSAYYR